MDTIKVFVSYASKDKGALERLKECLNVYISDKIIALWNDQVIVPGVDWNQHISEEIKKADIAILLVSENFWTSQFIQHNELPPIIKQYNEGKLLAVVPIILTSKSKFNISKISHFHAIPKSEMTISQWKDKDAAWKSVSDALEKTFEMVSVKKKNVQTDIVIDEQTQKIFKYLELELYKWQSHLQRGFSKVFENGLEEGIVPYIKEHKEASNADSPFGRLSDVLESLIGAKKRHIFLHGKGGSGKSTMLVSLLKQLVSASRGQTPILIDLKYYNDYDKKEQTLIYMIADKYFERDFDMAVAYFQKRPILLLLDGYNEISKRLDCFDKEITVLNARANVQLVLSTRYDYSPMNFMNHFDIYDVCPLTDEQLKVFFEPHYDSKHHYVNDGLLTNPFNLAMYLAFVKQQEYHYDSTLWDSIFQEQNLPYYLLQNDNPANAGRLLTHFCGTQLKYYCSEKLSGKDTLSKQNDFAYAVFLMLFVLPSIGHHCYKQGVLSIMETDLAKFLEDNLLKSISKASFRKDLVQSFPAFKSLFDNHESEKWKPYYILDFLRSELFVLSSNIGNNKKYIEFYHQNYRDYFAALHIVNVLSLHYKKAWSVQSPVHLILKDDIPFNIQSMVAEISLESEQPTVYNHKDGKWAKQTIVYNGGTRNAPSSILEASLEHFRGIMDNELLGKSVSNLVNMLIIGRSNDLAGIDLGRLMLSGINFYGIRLSKKGENENCVASFKGSKSRPIDFSSEDASMGKMIRMEWNYKRNMLQIDYENNAVKLIDPITRNWKNIKLPHIEKKALYQVETHKLLHSFSQEGLIATVCWNYRDIRSGLSYSFNKYRNDFFQSWIEFIPLGRIGGAVPGQSKYMYIDICKEDSLKAIASVTNHRDETFLVSKNFKWVVITRHNTNPEDSIETNTKKDTNCSIIIYRIPDSHLSTNRPYVNWETSYQFQYPEERLKGLAIKMDCSVILSAFHPLNDSIIATCSDGHLLEIDLLKCYSEEIEASSRETNYKDYEISFSAIDHAKYGMTYRNFPSKDWLIIDYAPNGKSFFASSKTGELMEYDLVSHQKKYFQLLPNNGSIWDANVINQLAFKTNNENLIEFVYFGKRGFNKVWELDYAELDVRVVFQTIDFRTEHITDCFFSIDYKSIICIGSNNALSQYGIDKSYLSLISKSDEPLAYFKSSGNGKYYSIDIGKRVQVRHFYSGKVEHEYTKPCSVFFHPKKNEFVSASIGPNQDLIICCGPIGAEQQEIYRTTGYESSSWNKAYSNLYCDLAFSPSGKYFALLVGKVIYFKGAGYVKEIALELEFYPSNIVFLDESNVIVNFKKIINLITNEVADSDFEGLDEVYTPNKVLGRSVCKASEDKRNLYIKTAINLSEVEFNNFKYKKYGFPINYEKIDLNWQTVLQINLESKKTSEMLRFVVSDFHLQDIDPMNNRILKFSPVNRQLEIGTFEGESVFSLTEKDYKDPGLDHYGVQLPLLRLYSEKDLLIINSLRIHGAIYPMFFASVYFLFLDLIKLILSRWNKKQMERKDKLGVLFRGLRLILITLWPHLVWSIVSGLAIYALYELVISKFWVVEFKLVYAFLAIFVLSCIVDYKRIKQMYMAVFKPTKTSSIGQTEAKYVYPK